MERGRLAAPFELCAVCALLSADKTSLWCGRVVSDLRWVWTTSGVAAGLPCSRWAWLGRIMLVMLRVLRAGEFYWG